MPSLSNINGSTKASQHGDDSLQEGDFLTGIIDTTNERVCMVLDDEEKTMVRACILQTP